MAIVSVSQQLSSLAAIKDERFHRTSSAAIVDAIQNLATKLDTLTAKMNADAGITDANYATDFASTTAAIVTD
jgi:hypothetical protein